MDRFKWISLDLVESFRDEMEKRGVSKVARGEMSSNVTKEGFMEAYEATNGSIPAMKRRKTGRITNGKEIETWNDRRNQFVARHLKGMRTDKYSSGWDDKGNPTNRHLGLIAWAYSPSPKRLEKWLLDNKTAISNPKLTKEQYQAIRKKRRMQAKRKASLGIKYYDGEKGNNSHVTAIFNGYIDPKYAANMFGKNQEHNKWDFKKGSCKGKGRYSTEDWNSLKQDAKSNGIREPILIVLEYDSYWDVYKEYIYEGNHRVRLACQLDIKLPVEIRFLGKAEDQDMYSIGDLIDSLSREEIKNPSSKVVKSAIHRIDADGVHERIGFVAFSDSKKGLKIDVDIKGIPNGEHGFHIHEYGSIEPKEKDGKMVAGLAAGQHYDPLNAGYHGSPTGHGHLGDLPFITAKNAHSKQTVYAPRLKLKDILNRSIIVHRFGDNYSDYPLPNGGGKSRIAGGIITNNCSYCRPNPFSAKDLEKILKKVFDKGQAAWASGGHRPFQTPQSWGYARVNSFITGGKTFFHPSADKHLAKKLPKNLYDAIYKERTYDPPKNIESKQEKNIIRDSKGRKIPKRYLDGFKGKERSKRIKEIEERRDLYQKSLKDYGDEKRFPKHVLDAIYEAWDSDLKDKSRVLSPYTKTARKRGFTGDLKQKSQAVLDYYLKKKNPLKKGDSVLERAKKLYDQHKNEFQFKDPRWKKLFFNRIKRIKKEICPSADKKHVKAMMYIDIIETRLGEDLPNYVSETQYPQSDDLNCKADFTDIEKAIIDALSERFKSISSYEQVSSSPNILRQSDGKYTITPIWMTSEGEEEPYGTIKNSELLAIGKNYRVSEDYMFFYSKKKIYILEEDTGVLLSIESVKSEKEAIVYIRTRCEDSFKFKFIKNEK